MKYINTEKASSLDGGIYRIINTTNNRIYIGSSNRIRRRYHNHLGCLMNSVHQNKFLQHDWNKCGADSFVFEVIEVENNKENRLTLEQLYIDKHYDHQKQCYNLMDNARANREGTKNRFPIPLDDKRRQSPSPELKAKRAAGLRKAYEEDPELRAKRAEITKKTMWKDHDCNITVTHMETGETVVVHGVLKEWCKERGLSYKAFNQLVKGKIKSSGGWFLGTEKPEYVERKGEKRKPMTQENREKHSNGKYEGRVLVNEKTGERIVLPRNLKQFAREKEWHYNSLIKLLNRECKRVCGLILSPAELI